MALDDEQILRQNPWWTRERWEQQDPHLNELEHQPQVFDLDPLAHLNLLSPGIHIVRGPRQVGKSTSLKRLVRRMLDAGRDRRHIIYLASDLLEGQPPRDLYASVARAKELARAEEPCLLMLDEVTMVSRWQTAIKSLWDDGLVRGDVVLCTGSSAIDLREGAAERLPGRRRAGDDVLVLPQSLGVVARALDDSIPASPGYDLAQIVSPSGRETLADMQIHLPALRRALERYVVFGGLPAAVAELLSGAAEPSRDAKRTMHDALIKDVARRGASRPAAHALLERIVRSLGSKTNWAAMAREMDVRLGPQRRPSSRGTPDPGTVRDYVELMADGYLLVIVYFWRKGSHSNALSNDKKMYFFDPLLHAVAREYAPGLADDVPARVENVLATHLLRRYEPRDLLLESPAEPQRLHVWGKESGEIDFIAGSWSERAALEVKYGNVKLNVASNIAKAHPARPAVVASKDTLILDRDEYVVVPAPLVAWALGT